MRRLLGRWSAISSLVAVTSLVLALGPASPASAAAPNGLGISVPSSKAVSGTKSVGADFLVPLGTVTVTTGGISILGGAEWTAQVSTSGFTTGGASAAETIPGTRIGYFSGVLGTVTGLLGGNVCTPAQLTETAQVVLGAPKTAMTCTGLLTIGSSSSVSWSPTIAVRGRPTDIAGTYTGTITHSVS